MKDLDKIIKEETDIILKLKKQYGNAFGIVPEVPEEYHIMKKTYDSVGEIFVNDMRVMMGCISNPSVDTETKEFYIKIIPTLLDDLDKKGKDVEYLRIAYEMVLKYK